MNKRKIIIDTDPGVDDAFALALASKYEGFEILGITASMGNKGLDITADNATKLAKYFGSNCKVYRGEDKYITSDEMIVSEGVHGNDGIGGCSAGFEYDNEFASDKSAVDFILETIEKYPGEVELITLAPLTNIAKAIQTNFDVMKKLKAIYSMGGGVKKGNVTPFAEFNYYADPKAVEITYTLGEFVDIYMFGLDVTHNTIFSANDLFFIKKIGGELGENLAKMADAYLDAYWSFNGYLGCVIHDLLVVAYAIDNSICPDIKKAYLTTEIEGEKQGATLCDFSDEAEVQNVNIPLSVDAFKYKKLFIETLFGSEACEKYDKTTKSMDLINHNYGVKKVLSV